MVFCTQVLLAYVYGCWGLALGSVYVQNASVKMSAEAILAISLRGTGYVCNYLMLHLTRSGQAPDQHGFRVF